MRCTTIKTLLMAFLVASILISITSALGITGAIISQEVSPGQELDREIIVGNGENDSTHVMTAEVLGYATNEGGANIALQPEDDTGPYTARPFLSIDPKNFTIGPGEKKVLRLIGTVPEDVTSGGLYASVVIMPEPVYIKDRNVNVVTGFMSLVMLTIKGSDLIKTGEIKNLSALTQENEVAAELLFENNGNVDYKPQVTVSLEDSDRNILSTKGPAEDRILPTCSRLFNFQITPEAELSPGKYNITAVAKLSDGTILDSKETTFTV